MTVQMSVAMPGAAQAQPVTPRAAHHGSHIGLLRPPCVDGLAPVDAIVVPTSRPSATIKHAIRLAVQLDCPVLALCSKKSSPATVARIGQEYGVDVIAIAFSLPSIMPDLHTSAMPIERFATRSDLSAKRNAGLLFARLAGWHSVLLLDDDIEGIRPDDVRRASAQLAAFTVVGLRNTGFPDNSVVCHAYREVGGEQGTFIGGGAMVLAPYKTTSLFPNVYCEDWLFLIDHLRRGEVSIVGRASQQPYDPFVPGRPRREELGDTLAEGVFSLLHNGSERLFRSYKPTFWQEFLDVRRKLINEAEDQAAQLTDDDLRTRILNALREARHSSRLVRPEFCAQYLAAYRSDRRRWTAFIKCQPTNIGVPGALEAFGWQPVEPEPVPGRVNPLAFVIAAELAVLVAATLAVSSRCRPMRAARKVVIVTALGIFGHVALRRLVVRRARRCAAVPCAVAD